MTTNGDASASRLRVAIASFWGALGASDGVQTAAVMSGEGMHHVWAIVFLDRLASWLPWALATPTILRLGRRFPLGRSASARTWVVHVTGAVAAGFAYAAWGALVDVVLDPYGDHTPLSAYPHLLVGKFLGGLVSAAVLYGVVLTAQSALDARERLAIARIEGSRLSEELSRAHLDALRRQIEPHFLFNTLNAIAGLVREGRGDAAVSTIATLSDFLRLTLGTTDRQEVPLREEMDLALRYLDIQKIRFADRLDLSVVVPLELSNALVPNLILQPLVENAVKHGIAKRTRGGAIVITVTASDGLLSVSVCNDGPKLPDGCGRLTEGIGIANVRNRLETLYGERFELRMRDRPLGGVEVLLSLPLHQPLEIS